MAGREIHRLTSLHTVPEFVKRASHERLCGDPETVPAHLYADPVEKLYPAHTPEATWMSSLFFFDKRAEFSPETADKYEAALLKAATYFGIAAEVEALRTKIAGDVGNDESRLPDEAFAIVWEYENGHKERNWPLRNSREVKFAAAHFATHRDKFEFSDRHKIAERILDAAVKFGAAVDGGTHALELAAGRGACSARDAAAAVDQRATMLRSTHPEYSAELRKTAEVIRQCPDQARGRDQLVKMAGYIDEADRIGGLNKMYGDGGLERPEEIFFRITEKVASTFVGANVATITGNTYDLDALEKVSVAAYREWLGDAIADSISVAGVLPDRQKLAEVIPTLDRGMASMLDRMLAAGDGPKPVLREKSAADAGALGGNRLYEMAARYSRR